MHPNAPLKVTGYNVADRYQHLSAEDIRQVADRQRLSYAVALANITGDLNAGMIIRTACVFGAQQVFVFGKRKYDRRSTVGAHHYIDVLHFEAAEEDGTFSWPTVLQTIRVNGYTPVIIEQGGIPLYDMNLAHLPTPICLVFGSEDMGVPSEVCNSELCFTIPQPGVLRSLNVSSAASIAMWHTVCNLMTQESIDDDYIPEE